ncbi:MAG: S8 family serine peptidase [bacterium]
MNIEHKKMPISLDSYKLEDVIIPLEREKKLTNAVRITIYGKNIVPGAYETKIKIGKVEAQYTQIHENEQQISGYLFTMPDNGSPIILEYDGEEVAQMKETFRASKMKGNIVKVTVRNHKGDIIPNANVTLRYSGQAQAVDIVLNYDDQQHIYWASNVQPGNYIIYVKAENYELDHRNIYVGQTIQKEDFIIGKKDMPFYYMGKTKVPYEPQNDLIAISIEPGITAEKEKDLITFVSGLGLEFVNVGEPILSDNARVLRFPSNKTDQERQDIQKRLSEHQLIRRVGYVIHLSKESLSFLTDELIVKFKANITEDKINAIARKFNLNVVRSIPYSANAYLFRSGFLASYNILGICKELVKSDLVEYAEPNMVTTAVDDFTPNDYLFSSQPHHSIIDSEGAWDITMGDDDIIIAVVDSGCDFNHPDLSGDVAPDVPKIYQRFNFANHTPNTLDDSHGTKSTGIATASADNSEGVAGVAPGCRVMMIRRPSSVTNLDFADMYIWIAGFDPYKNNPTSKPAWFPANISPGADVISNSFGLSQASLPGIMKDTFDFITTYGRNGKGCVVVFSVGNNNLDFTTYRHWAAYEKTIAVASSAISPPDATEVKVSSSNFGSLVDVCAPGGGPAGGTEARTLSTTNIGIGDTAGSLNAVTNDYDDFGQTSCACPQVAGVAALMLSANSHLTWVEVRDILRNTAEEIDTGNADPIGQWIDTDMDGVVDFSQWYGYGRINAHNAVQEANTYAENIDIVVRENLADVGVVPSVGVFYNSPDIWIRNADPTIDGAAALPAGYNNNPPHQNPMFGQDNWVYIRFKNVGTDSSSDFYIRAYITHFPGHEFIYPDDFAPTLPPSSYPPSPMAAGTYLIGEAHYSNLAAGDSDIVNIRWDQALVPPETVTIGAVTTTWHPCLLVEISPHDGPTPTGTHVWDNNNLAQKNISITYPDDDGAFTTAFVMGNKANRSKYLELLVDRINVPQQVQLYVQLLDPKIMRNLKDFIQKPQTEVTSSCCKITLLENTRLLIDCCPDVKGCCKYIITLPAMTKLEMAKPSDIMEKDRYNFRIGTYKGKEVLWLTSQEQSRIPIFAEPGSLVTMIIGGFVEKGLSGIYEIKLAQVNHDGIVSGGYGIQLNVV